MLLNTTFAPVVVSTFIAAIAIGHLASTLLRIARKSARFTANDWDMEQQRLAKLKNESWVMKHLEPLVLEVAELPWVHSIGNLKSVERNMKRAMPNGSYSGKEYLGMTLVHSVCLAATITFVGAYGTNLQFGVICGFATAGFLFLNASKTLAKKAERRIRRLKRRLPFAIDLMALMLESGGDIRHGLQAAIEQNRSHPVGEELGQVLNKMSGGQSLLSCLEELRTRLNDEDISEMVFSIKNAQELGVPLSKTLLTLAEQMRMKQIQANEKLIGERKVMMVFPGMIVTIACMIVAIAPMVPDLLTKLPNLLGE